MRKFFENKFTFAAIVMLFLAAFIWNSSQGAAAPRSSQLFIPQAVTLAHGPIMPPDPWDARVTVAHGPIMPPDPWDARVTVAHGPIMPPDPWDARVNVV